jgi:hypothetical protein
MTVEASNPSASYTVSGTGPYPLLWPYFEDGFAVYVEDAGALVLLTSLDYSASPVSSIVSGNLFLDPTIAATYAGKKINISRVTAAEQGWQGTQGERESGLEVQLDRLTMNAQEQAVEIASALRIIGGSGEPLAPVDQATFIWNDTLKQFQAGPSLPQIIADMIASAASAALATTKAAESAAARDAALAAFANFRDVYLGAFAADPATDIDGSPHEPGDLYFSTTANVMRVYTGSAWVNAYVSADGVVLIMNNLSDIASKPAALTILRGYNTTVTNSGTTTLTAASALTQIFTGVLNQTVVLPDPSTLALGWEYEIPSRTTGVLTINSSGGNLVATVPAGMTAKVKCILASGTTAASWQLKFDGAATKTGSGALVFGTSPSLIMPALDASTVSTDAAVIAGTNAQGQAPLTKDYNIVTTCAANPGGVTLPAATVGRRVVVLNRAPNAFNLYPVSGSTIGGRSADQSIRISPGGGVIFYARTATLWEISPLETPWVTFDPVATTSGTFFDVIFPPNVREVEAFLENVSLASSADLLFQFGSGGTVTTANYNSVSLGHATGTTSTMSENTTGIHIRGGDATQFISAEISFKLINAKWICKHQGRRNRIEALSGYGTQPVLNLAGALDQIRFKASDGAAFDGGDITWRYR